MSSSELHQLIIEYTNSHIRRKCQVTSAHHRIQQEPYQKKMSISELHQLIIEYTNSHIRRKCQLKSYISSSQNTPTAISEENVKLRVTSAHHRIHQQPYQKKMSSWELHQLITEYTDSHIRRKCQVQSYISSPQNTPTAIPEENVNLRVTPAHHRIHQQPYQK